MKLKVGVVLFHEFELLDVYGPLEMLGLLPDHFSIDMLAASGDPVKSAQGPRSVIDHQFSENRQYDVLLIPGGRGTRNAVNDVALIEWIKKQATAARYVTSVCTGSALLARTGLLDGRRATTNKLAFSWVKTQGEKVEWITQARWVEDGKFFTSSGVSAGIDMTLGFIAHLLGKQQAQQVADWSEYDWHSDANWDPFAKLNDLI